MLLTIFVAIMAFSVMFAGGYYFGHVVAGKPIQPIYNIPEIKIRMEYPPRDVTPPMPKEFYDDQNVAMKQEEGPNVAEVYHDVMDEFLTYGDFNPNRPKDGGDR